MPPERSSIAAEGRRFPRTSANGREHADGGGTGGPYVQSISTRSIDAPVKTMGMSGISNSQVSRLCEEIHGKVKAPLNRPPSPTCGSTSPNLRLRAAGGPPRCRASSPSESTPTAGARSRAWDRHAEAKPIWTKVPRLATLMDEANHDVLAYMSFPKEGRAKLHSTDNIDKQFVSSCTIFSRHGRPCGKERCARMKAPPRNSYSRPSLVAPVRRSDPRGRQCRPDVVGIFQTDEAVILPDRRAASGTE